MCKFQFDRISDWNALHRENINATRTVQQIKANIKEIKKLRNQVLEEDIEKFDDRTEPMVQQATQTLQDFVNLNTELSQTCGNLAIFHCFNLSIHCVSDYFLHAMCHKFAKTLIYIFASHFCTLISFYSIQ